jgi:hypothetical protein
MRNRFRGFTCALAALVVIYIGGWVSDMGGLRGIMDDDSYPFCIIIVPVVAAIFSSIILFTIILPQALLARLVVRRLCGHQAVPFIVFLGVSSVLIAPIARWHSNGRPFFSLVLGVVYLLAGCSVLWWISFRHEHVL